MPTGYTADVADGRVTDFRTFALRCARQFGATIMQRDDPIDEPPKLQEPSDYNAKRLAESRARLAELTAMSIAESERRAEMEYNKWREENAAARRRYAETRARYEAMLAEVQAWEPPTADHEAMKRFMVQQLTESIDFDCNDGYFTEPVRKTGSEWLADEKAKARKDITYHEKEDREERKRTEGRNAWIRALYDSLPATESVRA